MAADLIPSLPFPVQPGTPASVIPLSLSSLPLQRLIRASAPVLVGGLVDWSLPRRHPRIGAA